MRTTRRCWSSIFSSGLFTLGLAACAEEVETPMRDGGVIRDVESARDVPTRDAMQQEAGVVTCPMPPPAFVIQGGRCVPSCTAAGGNVCSAPMCMGRTALESYDCPTCCAVPPANCGGIPSNWVCTADGRQRQRCNMGQVEMSACPSSCVPGAEGADATCSMMTSTCVGSASGNAPTWTCTMNHQQRQRCVMSQVQSQDCANGCIENAVGADDTCAPAPAGCVGSASGTSGVWTCTVDRRQRQRCVMNAVQSEPCANGCIPQPLGTDDYCAPAMGGGCMGSASGNTAIWTCTGDSRSRQRCVMNSVQTEPCMYGCNRSAMGVDDTCLPMPMPGSGQANCSYPQWWNLRYSWDPGFYAVRYGWDSDLAMVAGTAVQLRHDSRLIAEDVYGWGWMPEFLDTVTNHRFRFLHLQPSRRLTRAIGTTYPAGTLVGYSGGNTADTGFPMYSTGAHLCVQTQVPYRTAFPMGMDPCR